MKVANPIRDAAVKAGFTMSASQARLVDCVYSGKEFAGPVPGKRATRIDARLIRWLCATREIARDVHAHGLNLANVTISGELDLNFVRCEFPITLEKCRLPGGCSLRFATFPLVCFIDCEFDELQADRVTVAQSLLLTGSTFQNELLLRGASIGGNLGLDAARLRPAGELALNLEGATIGGSLWMLRGFRADGAILIYGAEIKRNVESTGIIAAPRSQAALVIESSRIGGSLLLRSGFRCLGQVRIVGSSIQGSIDFQGARISAFGDVALLLERSKASRAIFMRKDPADTQRPFRCIGGISLLGTVAEGDLDFTDAIVTATGRPAVNLLGLKCEGQLMGRGAQIRGWLVLGSAIVKSNVYLGDATIGDGTGPAILARSHHCGGNFELRGATVRGYAEFQNLFVGDDLIASECRFEGRDGDAVILSSGRIRGAVDLGKSHFAGPLNLEHCTIGTRLNLHEASLVGLDAPGCTIGADFALMDATLRAPDDRGTAAYLAGLRCQGWLLLGDRFVCDGLFDFNRAILGGLHGQGARFQGAGGIAIDGAFAQVLGEVRLTDSSIEGGVRLDRASVVGSLDLSGCSLAAAGDAALDLSEARIGGTLFLANRFKVEAGEIRLSNADVATLRDDPGYWPPPGCQDIQGLTYRNIAPLEVRSRIGWLCRWRPIERGADGGGSWQPYEQLMETLRRHGRESDRKAVAIAKQRAIARSGKNWLVRALYAVYGATIRYGYEPQRALMFAPAFIGFSIFVFLVGADGLMVPTSEPVRKEWSRTHVVPAGYPSFNAVAYSVDSFVPILSLQQRDSWRPNDRATCQRGPENCGSLLRILLWLNTVFGWIVTTLAVAGFTGLIRRD